MAEDNDRAARLAAWLDINHSVLRWALGYAQAQKATTAYIEEQQYEAGQRDPQRRARQDSSPITNEDYRDMARRNRREAREIGDLLDYLSRNRAHEDA